MSTQTATPTRADVILAGLNPDRLQLVVARPAER